MPVPPGGESVGESGMFAAYAHFTSPNPTTTTTQPRHFVQPTPPLISQSTSNHPLQDLRSACDLPDASPNSLARLTPPTSLIYDAPYTRHTTVFEMIKKKTSVSTDQILHIISTTSPLVSRRTSPQSSPRPSQSLTSSQAPQSPRSRRPVFGSPVCWACVTDESGHSLLHWASLTSRLLICHYLIERCNADADTGHPTHLTHPNCSLTPTAVHSLTGQSPLMWASTHELNLDVIKYLIDMGADVNHTDSVGCTPLITSIQKKQTCVLLYLTHRGGNPHKADETGNTPAHWAACKGNVEVLRILTHLGCDIEAVDKKGQTVLHRAAMGGDISTAIHLVRDEGANVNVRNKMGQVSDV
eukprot:GHVN01015599.1.p1 GENE.GHVN01015599.1~~GHVN01015599.1.p1  ORF type:complete len:368 (-),score=107.60 GHVN01015599.1:856-1923(-)